jgi:WD40 repeat protein
VDDEALLATKLLARIEQAHGNHDVNCIVWCPYSGHEGVLATAGDDGYVRLWTIGS